MILAMHLEMIHELQNTLAEDRYLNLWRASVGLVGSIFCDYFVFGIGRQGHARIDTPRLVLISFFFYSITQARKIGQWEFSCWQERFWLDLPATLQKIEIASGGRAQAV